MEFTNRVAVITGGGSGIGRAVAAAMAKRGVAWRPWHWWT